MADRQLDDLLCRFRTGVTILVSSDHGMLGIRWNVHVNEALRRGGLLSFGPDGTIDLAKTSVLYHPANNGSLWVNDASRPGGIVTAGARPGVLHRAIVLLEGLAGVVRNIYAGSEPPVGSSGRSLGDLFLLATDGYNLRADPGPDGAVLAPAHKAAAHLTSSDHPSLHGIFYAKGDEIPRGRDLGIIDNRDVVTLVRHRLGIGQAADCWRGLS
jgi:hypothetical protein